MKIEIRQPTSEEIQAAQSWPTWSKEISEFEWNYTERETCLILEGRALIRDDAGEATEIKAGDWVIFESGWKCTWGVLAPIRKKYNFN